ncbi:hypothetical protein AEA09_08855 [Lysinibacillus contaminans]|uniref:Lipoprotein n=1 Tax=Lysinibacillus contaminans TaxID=1293441 RepID=A0ABR5K158_9BACI|nr:hypothetical protein [Lysinibacillus contaminans]KOS68643.1 hypothetical protein AEA09_08855 [Lysinibacillus contaminans]
MKENRIQKGKINIIALLGLLTSAILIGCENDGDLQQSKSTIDEVEIDTNKEQQSISEYTNEIEALQIQTEYLNKEKLYLVTVIKEIIEDFSDEEMLEFSRNQ